VAAVHRGLRARTRRSGLRSRPVTRLLRGHDDPKAPAS
jgi:hypothetical protein